MARILVPVLSLMAMLVAVLGVATGFRRPPVTELGLLILVPVLAPYAAILWLSARGQTARACSLAAGTAVFAFLFLALFAGVSTLFLGFAMGNWDQIAFVLLLDAFVLVQIPLGIAAWRARRGLPPEQRAPVGWGFGLGFPLAAAIGAAALFVGFKQHDENRVNRVLQNESAAREALERIAACLQARRDQGFPTSLDGLVRDGCIDAATAAGALPGHRLAYLPGLPDAGGRIRVYGLCAELVPVRTTGWRTYVADEAGAGPYLHPREGQVEPVSCAQAWQEDLLRRVKQCALDHAVGHPDRGYPASLDDLRAGQGTGCLVPAAGERLSVADAARVILGDRSADYRPGDRDASGRVAAFEIRGEALLGERRVNVMLDETGAVHAAEGRPATRGDAAPPELERRFQARKAEREQARARDLARCEAGEARLCRELGDSGLRDDRMGEADRAWTLGCEKGDGVSCLLAERNRRHEIFLSARILAMDCADGKPEPCRWLERMGQAHLACEKGDPAACPRVALRLGRRGEHDRANEIWGKACAAGNRESCYLLRVRDFEYKAAMELKDLCDDGKREACAEFTQQQEAFLAEG